MGKESGKNVQAEVSLAPTDVASPRVTGPKPNSKGLLQDLAIIQWSSTLKIHIIAYESAQNRLYAKVSQDLLGKTVHPKHDFPTHLLEILHRMKN